MAEMFLVKEFGNCGFGFAWLGWGGGGMWIVLILCERISQ